MMKLLASLLLLFPLMAYSQAFRSEIIKKSSYFQLKGGKLQVTDSVVLQINDRMGDRDALIAIAYSKGDQLSIEGCWIEDMSGTVIRKLKSSEIADRSYVSDFSLYQDDFIKWFELKGNVYPYRVVYSYKLTYSKFGSITMFDLAGSPKPVREGRVVVEAPLNQPIRYIHKNCDTLKTDTLQNSVKHTWTYHYEAPENPAEDNAPNTSDAPLIHIVPVNFEFGVPGSNQDWVSFGNWIYRLNKDRDGLPEAEKKKIDTLIANATDDEQKARILYHYLQDYNRYINVSIKLGGLQTYPATYVCENRYGDCKALSNYMQAMLKYAGIDAYYTLISSGEQVRDLIPDFPSNQFNHAMLTLPLGKDTVFLECTSKNLPFGYVHTSIQGRKALLVDEHNSRLIDLPQMQPKDVVCSRMIEVDANTSEVEISAKERGDTFETYLFLAADVDKDSRERYIRNTILPGTYELTDFKFTERHRDSTWININATLRLNNLAKRYGNDVMLSPFPFETVTYQSPDKRTEDFQMDYPQCMTDTIIYNLPGKNITTLQNDIHLKTEYGEYTLELEPKGSSLVVHKTLRIYGGRYTLEQYRNFYNFIQQVITAENKKLIIQTQ